MKRSVLIVIALACGSITWAAGPTARGIHPGQFELGLFLGEPTGVSAKLWADRASAFEGIAAWDFSRGALAVSVDYMLNFPDILKIKGESFPLFVGIGGIVRADAGAGVAVGLRVPLGVLYVFRDVPIEVSLEVVPGMNLFPSTGFIAMGGLGIRYCF